MKTERHWNISPSENLIGILSGFSEDQVLIGPDRDVKDVDIDDVFASDFKAALQDLMHDAGIERGDPRVLLQAVTTPLCDYATRMFHDGEILMEAPEDELRIVRCDFGVLLLQCRSDETLAKISGMFWGSTLIIDPISGIRGHGYGRDLVAARLMAFENLPTWDHDTPAYSHLGAVTVRSASRAILDLAIAHGPQEQSDQDFHP